MRQKKQDYYTIFSNQLLKWNRFKNKREMPWKFEKDPYKIWLSEIILQQTRVEQGTSYYLNFTQTYPTIHDLANAEDEAVMKLWEGLGYYSRCRNLLTTARFIANEQKGIFPNNYEELVKLKGVGPYTAAAIASFAYQLPHAVVDGNVIRVLSRFFGIEKPANTTEGKRIFQQLAQDVLDKKQPGLFNQAMMDFGATVCKPSQPLCNECVMKNHCSAYVDNKVDSLPVKSIKAQKRTRHFIFLVYRNKKNIYIEKRTKKDIWKDLFQFPLIETKTEILNQQQKIKPLILKESEQKPLKLSFSRTYKQELTHQTIKAVFTFVDVTKKIRNEDWIEVSAPSIHAYGFPKIIRQFIAEYSGEFC